MFYIMFPFFIFTFEVLYKFFEILYGLIFFNVFNIKIHFKVNNLYLKTKYALIRCNSVKVVLIYFNIKIKFKIYY